MENPDLWSGKEDQKTGPLSSVEATAKALKTVLPESESFAFAIDKVLPKKGVINYKDLKRPSYALPFERYLNKPESIMKDAGSAFKIYEFLKSGNKLPNNTILLNKAGEVIDGNNRVVAQLALGITDFDFAVDNGEFDGKSIYSKISEAYHKAKKDGTNPELVKAVEDLLGGKEVAMPKGTEQQPSPEPKGIDALIQQAEAALKEIKEPGTMGANKPIGIAFLEAYIAILKAAKAAGEILTAAQARIRARKKLIDEGYNPSEVNAAMGVATKILNKQAPPVPPTPPTTPQPQGGEGEVRERKFVTNVKSSSDITDAVKNAFEEDRINYKVLPNEISVKEANAILDAVGIEKAREMVLGANRMPGAFRTTLAQIIIKKYNETNQNDKAVSLVQDLAEMATDWGQAIQALSLLKFLTPEGQLLAAQRAVNKMRDKKFKQHETRIKKVKKAVDDATKEAAKEVADKVKGRFPEKAPEGTPKEYGASNKIFKKSELAEKRKALKSYTFAAFAPPPELVWIAGYHIEAGSRSFADFAKAMVKETGKRVKPLLKQLYKEAQKNVGGTGFSSDKEIAEYMANEIDKDILKAAKDLDIKISELIYKHYTETDAAKQKLAEKLVEQLGLDPSDALIVQKAVDAEFGKIIKEKQKKALDKIFNPITRRSRKIKRLEQKLVELSNLGGFDLDALKEVYAKAMEFPELTTENAAKIKELAEKVQNTKEGLFKKRAIEDLLKYQAQIKGWSWTDAGLSVWMSSILSGPSTQAINIIANTLNLINLVGISMIRNPKTTLGLLDAMRVGLGKGFFEAADVLRTGYSPIKDKAQIPDLLERMEFYGKRLNPFNYYKYVRRVMTAADVLTFEPLQEMRAYQLAYQKTGSRKAALELLNRNSEAVELAQEEAELEYKEIVANIESNPSLDKGQKIAEKAYALLDKKRRVYEIMAEKRPEEIVEESHAFAERGTFNKPPSGLLGFIAKKINETTYKVPALRFVVPFTNVVTNVANESLNYGPVGLVRAFKESGSITGLQPDKNLSKNEKTDMLIKGVMGTTVAVLAYALSGIKDDDEEDEMVLQFTANGYNDFAKNRELKESGWMPYSVKFKGKWYSYKQSLLRPIFAAIGTLRDYERYRGKDIDEKVLNRWSLLFGSYMQEVFKTAGFVESANTFVNAIMNEKKVDKIFDNSVKWLTSTSATLLPVVGTNLYQQLTDQFLRIMGMPEKEYYDTYFGRVMRNVPVAISTYNNRVNGLGEELPPKATPMILGDEPEGPYTKIWQLLAKNSATTGLQSPKLATLIKNGEEVPMTQEEYYSYAKYRGEFMREVLTDNYEYLAKLSKDKFENELNDIKELANSIGKMRVENPAIETYRQYIKAKREKAQKAKQNQPKEKGLSDKIILIEYFAK
jgi:hypothetical protein